MMLTNASWELVRKALRNQSEVVIPAQGDGMSFSVQWIKESYQNPIDGLVYHAEGGWEKYGPEGASQDEGTPGPVKLKAIVLLTDESELELNVGINPLGAYINAISSTVRELCAEAAQASEESAQELIVELEVRPRGAVDLKMTSGPGIADELLQGLHSRLQNLPAPEIHRGPIRFQMVFRISWE